MIYHKHTYMKLRCFTNSTSVNNGGLIFKSETLGETHKEFNFHSVTVIMSMNPLKVFTMEVFTILFKNVNRVRPQRKHSHNL